MTDLWSGLADMLAGLIEKHISSIDLDTLPAPPSPPKRQKESSAVLQQTPYPCKTEIKHP